MPLPAFDACLACGLQRGEVTAAGLTVEIDRLQFTLRLDCVLSPSRAQAIAESFLVSRPPVRELLIQTEHGAWRWREDSLESWGDPISTGVEFVASTREPINGSEFWEQCLAAFRVSLTEDWKWAPLTPPRYDASQIRVLEGLAPVRRRPTMYLGPTADPHLLVDAVLRHAAMGWLAETTKTIEVELSASGTLSVRDDGYPYSFDSAARGQSWVEASFSQLFGAPLEARGPDDRARNEFEPISHGIPLAVATGLSTELVVESSDGVKSRRQRFIRGRALPPEEAPPWQVSGTRITFTPDLDLLDTPLDPVRVRSIVERLASLCPGRAIQLNGVRVAFDSLLDAGIRRLAKRPAWNGALFEHTYRSEKLIFRCAIGLSADGNGELDNVVNLSPAPRHPEERIGGEHVDALLAAVVDAVRLPCKQNEPVRPISSE